MKICPVCNDSFADQLSFCDIDGARLTREGSAQERNSWWSLLGAALLVGALVITAASIFFLPKARVSPIVSSDPQSTPAPAKPASAESAANVAAAPSVSVEPEGVPTDVAVPEVKKKDRALANANLSETPPDPKAAARAAEDPDKKSGSTDVDRPLPPAPARPETPPTVKSVGDTRSADANKPQPLPDLKKDQKTQPAIAKSSDKDSTDKKKADEKDKKKGGFLRVFKKIFGKD